MNSWRAGSSNACDADRYLSIHPSIHLSIIYVRTYVCMYVRMYVRNMHTSWTDHMWWPYVRCAVDSMKLSRFCRWFEQHTDPHLSNSDCAFTWSQGSSQRYHGISPKSQLAVPHALKGHPDHVQSNISVKPSRQTTPNSKRNLLNIIELQSSQDASLDKWLCNDMNEYQNRFDHKPVYTPNPGAARSSAFSKYRTTKEGNEATNECCSLRSWAYGNLTGKYRRTST